MPLRAAVWARAGQATRARSSDRRRKRIPAVYYESPGEAVLAGQPRGSARWGNGREVALAGWMPLPISRVVLGAAPLELPHPAPVGPTDLVEAFPGNAIDPRRTQAVQTLDRILAAKPSLVDALPAHLSSASAKLLYVATHRVFSKGLTFSVPIGTHDSVRVQADGGLALTSPGSPTLRLHNQHDDLAQLLEGAQAWEGLEETTLEALLREALHRFQIAARFDGGGAAADERGGRAFTFATIQQVLVSPDPDQRGLECLASAAVHLWKSMGLVPPGLSREEFEHRFTSIHGDRGTTVRLGPEFNKTLRGGRSEVRLDANATAAFANALRADDWAKITGASNGMYSVRSLPSVEALVRHFEQGGAGVRASWADGGHYFVISGAWKVGGEVFVNEDDSLRRVPAKRKGEGDQPYTSRYDARYETRFWTLVREG